AALAPEPGVLLVAGALGLVTAVLAAVLPAWRAARVAVAETMRSRGSESPGVGGRAPWVLRGVALAAVGAGLAAQARHPSAACGLLATALVAAGAALAARPAVHAAGFLLDAGSRRLAGPVGRLAAASLLHNPRRTALTVATLGVGLGCVVWFWTMAASFLVNFGARVGDSVVLETPSGPLVLVIGGATAAFESPAGTIQMSREVFTRYWRDRQVNRVGVYLAPGAAVAAVRAAIARDLAPAYDLRILSARELIGYYAAQVGRAFAPLHVLSATVLLVTLLGVADTLLAAVLGRTRELGAARAVGIRRAAL